PVRTRALLGVVLVVVLGSRGHDLATRVGAAHRAHAMRPARAVAARALIERGRPDLVLGAPLGGAAVGLLFLGDRHRAPRLPARPCYSSLSSDSLAQRASGARSCAWPGPASLRSAAHTGHRPAQSSRHSTFTGAPS